MAKLTCFIYFKFSSQGKDHAAIPWMSAGREDDREQITVSLLPTLSYVLYSDASSQ
jgi:hypothetical protein